jgi:cytochrome c biogenesis protein CcmG/thiol:disulfide interchange protein DsbE
MAKRSRGARQHAGPRFPKSPDVAEPRSDAQPRATAPKGRPTMSTRDRKADAARASFRRRRRTRFGLAAAAVAIVAAVAVLAVSSADNSTGVTSPQRFDLPHLRGDARVKLADYRGTPVVVNFFASWCSACDAELPGFSTVSKQLKGTVQFIGVDSLETGDPLYMPRRHHILWWPLARDIRGAQKSGLHDELGGGNSMPLTAFYDKNGKLLEVERAALSESTLREKLHTLYGVDV